ncbi:MAG: YaaA family protein, partial [Bacteroidetes bacterium]|nr:YaaA family protein [Bacteroidota bacterium]
MRIILSPSKTQNHQCRNYPHWTLPPFLDKSKLLVEKLRSYDVKGLATLMKMSEKLALLNWHRFQDFQFPPHEKIAHQALLTFQGDVFNPIACDTYTDADFLFAQDHIRILSGLYGVLRPLDLIQPYRLEMATKFSSSKQ